MFKVKNASPTYDDTGTADAQSTATDGGHRLGDSVKPLAEGQSFNAAASGGLDATASFEHVDSEAGEALGRLAAWCSRCVRAALRAAERASDDESSVPPRRGRRRAARDDDSYQSDLSSLNTTPRGMIKRRARRRTIVN